MSGRASGHKKLSDEFLVWSPVWSEVQMICIWSSWCHCYPIITCFDCNQYCTVLHSDKDHHMGGPNMTKTHSRWQTTAILKNWKIAITPQQIYGFWQNLVWWCIWTLWIPSANKIWEFLKYRMAAAAILKNGKIAITPQHINGFWWNLMWWYISALWTHQLIKLRISEIPDGSGRHLEKLKITIILQWIDTFQQNLAWWCISAFWTPSTTTTTIILRLFWIFSRTTRVSLYQKGKTRKLIQSGFTEAQDSEWQWHLLGHMQICTLPQTDNHASISPISFYRPDAPLPPNR